MINYETAKKLKDAGFPQDVPDWRADPQYNFVDDSKLNENGFPVEDAEMFYDPTLSELIEACLDLFFPCSFTMGGKNTWWAVMRDETNQKAIVPVQTGKTPEEAVALLWLKLKKLSTD